MRKLSRYALTLLTVIARGETDRGVANRSRQRRFDHGVNDDARVGSVDSGIATDEDDSPAVFHLWAACRIPTKATQMLMQPMRVEVFKTVGIDCASDENAALLTRMSRVPKASVFGQQRRGALRRTISAPYLSNHL
jgi:hypothetical protein